jgi:hypothetical protein
MHGPWVGQVGITVVLIRSATPAACCPPVAVAVMVRGKKPVGVELDVLIASEDV